jgi:hypothetical protein
MISITLGGDVKSGTVRRGEMGDACREATGDCSTRVDEVVLLDPCRLIKSDLRGEGEGEAVGARGKAAVRGGVGRKLSPTARKGDEDGAGLLVLVGDPAPRAGRSPREIVLVLIGVVRGERPPQLGGIERSVGEGAGVRIAAGDALGALVSSPSSQAIRMINDRVVHYGRFRLQLSEEQAQGSPS